MRLPKLRQLIAAFTVCIAAAATFTATGTFAVTTGDQAPAWSGTNLLDGETVHFPEVLQEKPAIIVFWATWCPYCKAFMPYVKALQAKYAEQGVQVISFNAKERGRGDPKAYVEALDFPFYAIADADDIAEDYDIPFIPGLMVVDGTGRVAYRRKSTDLPAGKTVSQQWAEEVDAVLATLVAANAPDADAEAAE